MSTPETANLKQYAVLWVVTGYDKKGDVQVDDPIEIRVKWERNEKMEESPIKAPISSKGNVVYVDREIALGSRMWQGKLIDLPDSIVVSQQAQVMSYDEVGDIKGRKFQRTVTVG